MFEIVIKNMAEQHLEQISQLEKICFSVPWSKSLLKTELGNEKSKFLVAVDKNEDVLGYVGLNFVLDEGYITNIAVFPEFRRFGIAKKLLGSLIDFAYIQNLKFISLEVRKSNFAAIKFYENMQFLSVGVRKNFYSFPKEDAIIMTKFLN